MKFTSNVLIVIVSLYVHVCLSSICSLLLKQIHDILFIIYFVWKVISYIMIKMNFSFFCWNLTSNENRFMHLPMYIKNLNNIHITMLFFFIVQGLRVSYSVNLEMYSHSQFYCCIFYQDPAKRVCPNLCIHTYMYILESKMGSKLAAILTESFLCGNHFRITIGHKSGLTERLIVFMFLRMSLIVLLTKTIH